jgi:heat shock protein HslJ
MKRLIKTTILGGILFLGLPFAVSAGGTPESESITGVVWKWQQTRYNNDQLSVPPDSSSYTIEFMPDGRMYIRADCNQVGGNYKSEGSIISIELTHSTRAMCPPDSLDQDFKNDLNAAKIYFFKDGLLFLDLKYDSGTMRFGR